MEHKNLFTSFLIFILSILKIIGAGFKWLLDICSLNIEKGAKKINEKNDMYLKTGLKRTCKPSKIRTRVNGFDCVEDFMNPKINN